MWDSQGGDLVDVTQTYLRTILELEEEQVVPRRARIVERASHSFPRVHQVTARMIRAGLLVSKDDGHLLLTEAGRSAAVAVMRKHRLAEVFLVELLGIPYEQAHAEACQWQHVLSASAERRLYYRLGRPTHSPYGNPIPGLAELGVATPAAGGAEDDQPLLSYGTDGEFVVSRICEGAQRDAALLRDLRLAGVGPGVRMTVAWVDGGVLVTRSGTAAYLNRDMAALVFVEADELLRGVAAPPATGP